jgi:SAM-dependent methyltransferase
MIPVQEAFDRHSANYDVTFAGADVRREVWECAETLFPAGSSVLDIGCGTGEDALHFAGRGIHVTALDISPGMIAQTQRKAGDLITCEVADMTTYTPAFPLDGVFSNFGALNCVPTLDWLTALRVRSGGYLVLTMMGRLYPLEFAVSVLKGKPRSAFRRMRRSSEAVVEGVRFDVYYHTLRELKRALAPQFELIRLKGLRSLLPSPQLAHLKKFPAFRLLEPLDRFLCSSRATAQYSDHYLTVWRRFET